jgi:signal transduction histidine kinase
MKKEKNLKANFFLIFAGAGLLISFGVCAMMYGQFRSHVKNSYFDTLERVAVMIKEQFPVLHDIEKLKQGAENDEDWFWETTLQLGVIRESFGLAYVYFVEKTDTDTYVFRMSSRVNKPLMGQPLWSQASPVPPEAEKAYHIQERHFSASPTVNDWGVLVSVFSPFTAGGSTVGLLGVDYDISYVNALHRRLFIFLVIAFSASAILTGLLAFFGSRQVLVSIDERERAAREAEERRMEIENLMKALKSAASSKSTFMANISHKMADPINDIIKISSKMMGDKTIIERQGKNLELITDSGITLLNVINDILDITKLEAGQMKISPSEYKTPDFISDVSSYHKMIIENKPITFTLNIDEKLPLKLFGDSFRIKQICYHLLDNAYRYTSEGAITLSITCKHEEKYVWLFVKVSDTGKGIHKEEIDNLFADYGQVDIVAKYKAGGTGLGLNIIDRIAKLMKGKITVVSEHGAGSAFTLCVPQRTLSQEVIGSGVIKQLKAFQYTVEKAPKLR